MADDGDNRLMPEKTVEWLQDEALRLCRTQVGCGHLQAVRIGPTKPKSSGPNWELLAFKPELFRDAHNKRDGGDSWKVRAREAQDVG